jgi:hypothetical protein
MKKRILHLLAIAGFMFILTGCPYESEVPIDEPSYPVPEKLVGKWKKSSSTDESYFQISKTDANNFTVQENSWNSDSGTYSQTNYTAFISSIGSNLFLNLKKEGTTAYYLYKMEWSGEKELKLTELSNYIREKFTSSAALKKFIKKNMKYSFFYADEESYIKQ